MNTENKVESFKQPQPDPDAKELIDGPIFGASCGGSCGGGNCGSGCAGGGGQGGGGNCGGGCNGCMVHKE